LQLAVVLTPLHAYMEITADRRPHLLLSDPTMEGGPAVVEGRNGREGGSLA
jgi:hypothetical protein